MPEDDFEKKLATKISRFSSLNNADNLILENFSDTSSENEMNSLIISESLKSLEKFKKIVI